MVLPCRRPAHNCTHETVLRFLPPYIANEKEVDSGETLAKLFAKVK